MTVLICYDYFLPAYRAGGPVQSIANLVEQPDSSIQYRIFCSNRDIDGSTIKGVPFDCWTTYNTNTRVWYASDAASTKSFFKNKMNTADCDVIMVNGMYSYQFTVKPLLFSKAQKKIISARGMLHPGALSQKPLKKQIFLHFVKVMGWHRKFVFHASTEQEKQFIQNVFGKRTTVSVAANIPRLFDYQQPPAKSTGELRIVSVALISPMKNHLLVLKALKKIQDYRVHYDIYGPVKDCQYWDQCKKIIVEMPGNITVQYHGELDPRKVEGALRRAHVFVLPSLSENFGHSIIEAMSAGRPVITSNNTPWQQLSDRRAGKNVSLNEGEIASAISFFGAMNAEELDQWSRSARAYAQDKINVTSIQQQYKKMFAAI